MDGYDAVGMLRSYVKNKTLLSVEDSKDTVDFIFTLDMKTDGKKRIGLITVTDAKTKEEVWVSEWTKGSSMNQYYGYSGTRHSIGKMIKYQFSKSFPALERKRIIPIIAVPKKSC